VREDVYLQTGTSAGSGAADGTALRSDGGVPTSTRITRFWHGGGLQIRRQRGACRIQRVETDVCFPPVPGSRIRFLDSALAGRLPVEMECRPATPCRPGLLAPGGTLSQPRPARDHAAGIPHERAIDRAVPLPRWGGRARSRGVHVSSARLTHSRPGPSASRHAHGHQLPRRRSGRALP